MFIGYISYTVISYYTVNTINLTQRLIEGERRKGHRYPLPRDYPFL